MGRPLSYVLKRELRRLGRQITGSPEFITSYLLARPYYDLVLARKKKEFDGKVAETPRIAIYLIFPSSGVLASHLWALDYLQNAGYAPLVVSNVPLSDADRAIVLDRCWRYIERENFGYDFGGYRDGVLSIAQKLPKLERLVLLNDSNWFPLPGTGDWLAQMEALGTDLGAAVSNYCVTKVPADRYNKMRWDYSVNRRRFHYCSFALGYANTITSHPAFLKFWQRFRLSNVKKRTVSRGEIGLTQWVLKHGFSHAQTCDIAHLDTDLATLPAVRLEYLMRNLIIPEKRFVRRVWAELIGQLDVVGIDACRKDVELFILTAVATQGASYVLPAFTMREKHYPFLKKTPIWQEEKSSDITLDLIRGIDAPIAVQMLREAQAIRANRAPDFPLNAGGGSNGGTAVESVGQSSISTPR